MNNNWTLQLTPGARQVRIYTQDEEHAYERLSRQDRADLLGLLPLVDAGYGKTTVWFHTVTRITL